MQLMLKNPKDLTNGEKELLSYVEKVLSKDEYKKIKETVFTYEEARKYINSDILGLNIGLKTYFPNEISNLPKQITYEKDGYIYTYVLTENSPLTFNGVELSDDDIITKDGGVISNKLYGYKLFYTNEPKISAGTVFVSPIKGAGEATGRMNMAGKTHPVSGVEFDASGFPKFKSEYDMHLEPKDYLKSRGTHFDKASKSLYDEIQGNSELASKFTQNEIDIFKEGGVPKRFTWHHNQEPGLMELVDRTLHRQTGHDGGFSIWGPGNK